MKQSLPRVAASHHMVNRAWKFNAEGACHLGILDITENCKQGLTPQGDDSVDSSQLAKSVDAAFQRYETLIQRMQGSSNE